MAAYRECSAVLKKDRRVAKRLVEVEDERVAQDRIDDLKATATEAIASLEQRTKDDGGGKSTYNESGFDTNETLAATTRATTDTKSADTDDDDDDDDDDDEVGRLHSISSLRKRRRDGESSANNKKVCFGAVIESNATEAEAATSMGNG
jgi:hypothetical protein